MSKLYECLAGMKGRLYPEYLSMGVNMSTGL